MPRPSTHRFTTLSAGGIENQARVEDVRVNSDVNRW